MEIDNFSIFLDKLTFETNFDRYIVHILKRSKDDKGKSYGTNETNRLIKTFYITSREYLERKIPVIKDLCLSYSARAYILPQVRNNEACLRELLKIVVDNLDNPTIKPDHLIRTAFCGYHGSRDKKWILDLDSDNMTEYHETMGFPCSQLKTRTWKPDEVLSFVQDQLEEINKPRTDAYMIPTKSGYTIITSPFNLQKAYEKCRMMYQGLKKKVWVGDKDTGPGEHEGIYKDINGWVIKDGMALCFYAPKKVMVEQEVEEEDDEEYYRQNSDGEEFSDDED